MRRDDFPIIENSGVVYLDSSATTFTPKCVVDKIVEVHEHFDSNVGRSQHKLANKATREFDAVRGKVAKFIGAKEDEVVFTAGATMGINLVTLGLEHTLTFGDNVVIGPAEHNSLYLPFKRLCEMTGAELRIIPLKHEMIDYRQADALIDSNTRLVGISTANNITGEVTDVSRIVDRAQEVGAEVLLDQSQCIGHVKTDVSKLGVNYVVFSGHKMYAPYSTGVLWSDRLYRLDPAFHGSGMWLTGKDKFATPPSYFETGTPNISGVIGLGAAIDYLAEVGLNNIANHEHELEQYLSRTLHSIEGLTILGPWAASKCPIVSFVCDGVNMYDLGELLDSMNIAVRVGKHCNEATQTRFGVEATCRVSLGLYSTFDDIDHFIKALKKSIEMLKRGAD